MLYSDPLSGLVASSTNAGGLMSSSGRPSLDNIIKQTPERKPMEPPRIREMFVTGLLSFESSAIDDKETEQSKVLHIQTTTVERAVN